MKEILEAVLRLIQADPHQWSTRPCQTCTAISVMTETKFGCVLKAAQSEEGKKS